MQQDPFAGGLGIHRGDGGKQDQGPVVSQLLAATLPCKHLEPLPVNELLSQVKQLTVQLGLSGMTAVILNSL